MTIKRKPTDAGTPVMLLENLSSDDWITVWADSTKVGHRMQVSTLRAWLLARMVAPAAAGRVLVTDGDGGVVDSGVALNSIGAGGAPPLVVLRQVTGDSATVLEADHRLGIWVVDDGTPKTLTLPPERPVGTETTLLYRVYGMPSDAELQFAGGIVFSGLAPVESVASGAFVRLVKVAIVSAGEETFHVWEMTPTGGGSDGGSPSAHASSHGVGGNDLLTPAMIGAVSDASLAGAPPGLAVVTNGSGGVTTAPAPAESTHFTMRGNSASFPSDLNESGPFASWFTGNFTGQLSSIEGATKDPSGLIVPNGKYLVSVVVTGVAEGCNPGIALSVDGSEAGEVVYGTPGGTPAGNRSIIIPPTPVVVGLNGNGPGPTGVISFVRVGDGGAGTWQFTTALLTVTRVGAQAETPS